MKLKLYKLLRQNAWNCATEILRALPEGYRVEYTYRNQNPHCLGTIEIFFHAVSIYVGEPGILFDKDAWNKVVPEEVRHFIYSCFEDYFKKKSEAVATAEENLKQGLIASINPGKKPCSKKASKSRTNSVKA